VGELKTSKIESSTFSVERNIHVYMIKENILEHKFKRMVVPIERAHGRGNKYIYDYFDINTSAKAHFVM